MEVILGWLAEIFSGISVILLLLILWKITNSQKSDVGDIVREEFRLSRSESSEDSRRLREEVARAQRTASVTVVKIISQVGKVQQEGLERLEKRVQSISEAHEIRFEKLRETVAVQLQMLQENNEKKLEQMRQTVDEKLQSTLEKRLGESFKLVSERLEAVQRGLGDMQSLATGVGDLKRMLTNVKARGTWGEFQLGDILSQILTPEQFAKNVQPKAGSGEIVEYAVRLPGSSDSSTIWLPIDCKFPQEDY
ncbi:MAG: DNA recombination protein RmuC, partial [Deltaproteobacteria bacterium]